MGRFFGLAVLAAAAAWAQTPVSISVNTSSSGIPIAPDFVGLSFETDSLTSATGFPDSNPVFQQMVSQLAPGWLRFGGNSVDRTTWQDSPRTSSTPANTLTTSDRVLAFARATGWRVLLALDLAIGGMILPVQSAGPRGQDPAFDQVNVLLPPSLAGSGTANVVLNEDGVASNAMQIAL